MGETLNGAANGSLSYSDYRNAFGLPPLSDAGSFGEEGDSVGVGPATVTVNSTWQRSYVTGQITNSKEAVVTGRGVVAPNVTIDQDGKISIGAGLDYGGKILGTGISAQAGVSGNFNGQVTFKIGGGLNWANEKSDNANAASSGFWLTMDLNPYNFLLPLIGAVGNHAAGRVASSYQPPRCFFGGTEIFTPLGGAKLISDIRVGDTVLAFDPAADLGRGALVPRKVVRLYRNTTEEWMKLTWVEGGKTRELVTTPGHHFLDRFGQFPTIDEMLRDGKATVVLASGELTEVTAERIRYSAATTHMFEQAQVQGMVVGNAALKAFTLNTLQTCNSEVNDLHNFHR